MPNDKKTPDPSDDSPAASEPVSRPSPAQIRKVLGIRDFKRDLTPEEWQRLSDDIDVNSDTVFPRQMLQWARGTLAVAERLTKGPDDAVAALFWVRLYGLLKDLADVLKRHHSLAEVFPSDDARLLVRIVSALDSVRRQLSDDEVVYLQYRRQAECHPFQHDYRFTRVRDGGLKDTSKSHLLARPISLEEVRAAVKRVEGAAGWNSSVLAMQWAVRLVEDLRVVHDALRPYCGG
jgi:hypothetical protein